MKPATEPVPFVKDIFTSNCLKADVSVRNVQIVMVARIIGTFTLKRICDGVAPSISAASITSAGT